MADAVMSECGTYRYMLRRKSETLYSERGTALFVMLNPSTADATKDDPTIRRCRGFAKAWGCAGILVANLYAYRSTDPRNLWKAADPVGPENDAWLSRLARECGDVICAWGAHAKPERVKAVSLMMRASGARLFCLGTTKSGAPKHPLYIPAAQPAILWEAPSDG